VIARTGLVGDACYFNVFHDLFLQAESCSEGLFCWNERCFDPEDALEEGMACTSEDLCDGGLTCIANQCAKRSAEGESCANLTSCDPTQGLYCQDGTCAKREEAGTSCTANIECENGTHCIDSTCTDFASLVCLIAEF